MKLRAMSPRPVQEVQARKAVTVKVKAHAAIAGVKVANLARLQGYPCMATRSSLTDTGWVSGVVCTP